MSNIVPFFPFTDEEAAVVAHKYFLQGTDVFRRSVSRRDKRLVGDVWLSAQDDGALCRYLAQEGYLKDTSQGARSLSRIVIRVVSSKLTRLYLHKLQPILEGGQAKVFAEARLVPTEDGGKRVVVVEKSAL